MADQNDNTNLLTREKVIRAQDPITLETINPLIATGSPVGGMDTLLRIVSLLHMIQDLDIVPYPPGIHDTLQICVATLTFIVEHGHCEIPDMGVLTGSLKQAEDVA